VWQLLAAKQKARPMAAPFCTHASSILIVILILIIAGAGA
jgi:hypothetical protein